VLGAEEGIGRGIREEQTVGEDFVSGGFAISEQGRPGACDSFALYVRHGGKNVFSHAAQHLALVHLEAEEAVAHHHLMAFKVAFIALLQVLSTELKNKSELEGEFAAQELDESDATEQIEADVIGGAGTAERGKLESAEALFEVSWVDLRQRVMLDVGATIRRAAEGVGFLHAGELLHLSVLLDQMLEMAARRVGELPAEEYVRVNVVNARDQTLKSEGRYIGGQGELARHLKKLCSSEKRQRRHLGSSLQEM
jgi:hypothetical protein